MGTWRTALEAGEENQCLQGSLTIRNRVGTAMPAMTRPTLNHGCRFTFSKKQIVFKRKINYILKLLHFLNDFLCSFDVHMNAIWNCKEAGRGDWIAWRQSYSELSWELNSVTLYELSQAPSHLSSCSQFLRI